MIVPILLFVLERLHREYTGNKHTIFINAKKHSHNCTEIELYKPDFEFKPGQWVLLKCPEISRFQWHPFTITSNPIENGKVQLFIKERGEWTTQLSELLLKNNVYKNNIELKISKPYGCSYNIISQYRTVVLIAGGIGITSFISLLKSLPCKLGHGNTNVYLKKVHLHWVCKNSYDFDCFIIELNKIKGVLDEYGNLLELNYYVTAGLTAGNTRVYKKIYPPSIDFIHKRPDFEIIFEKLNKNNPDTNVRVIICGSKKMTNDIYKINKNYGNKFIIKNYDYFN
jgi:NADPH oxidase